MSYMSRFKFIELRVHMVYFKRKCCYQGSLFEVRVEL